MILGGVGAGNSYFDPLAFARVTEVRFGNARFNSLRGPGVAQWDLGLFRRLTLSRGKTVQVRVEGFNVTNRPHFNVPGSNVSSMVRNADGSIRSLGGYTEITGTTGTKSERQVRLGIRFGF